MDRRSLVMGVSLVLIVVAVHAAGLTHAGSVAEERPEVWSGLPGPKVTVASAERVGPATLPEVAALSSVVVEGTVTAVDEGPVVDRSDGPLGLLRATVEVQRTYRGSTRRSVAVLFTGFRPDDGAIVAVDLELQPEPGDHGIWFLHPAELAQAPGAYLASTSAGTIIRTDRGTSVTGGDSEAAAVACRRSWSALRLLVAAAVADARDTTPLRPDRASPHADPSFVGNPCARPHHDLGPVGGG